MKKKETKITIVGGTGRIGQLIVKTLLADGFEVAITGRNLKKAQEVASKLGAEALVIDRAVGKADVVIVTVPQKNMVNGKCLNSQSRKRPNL